MLIEPPQPRPWVALVVGAGLLLLLACGVLPATRTLVSAQLQLLATPPTGIFWTVRRIGVRDSLPDSDPREEQALVDAAARRAPGDYLVALGNALNSGGADTIESRARIQALHALLSRFPGHPALYAHLLRYQTAASIRIRRGMELETFLKGRASIEATTEPRTTPSADDLTQFDHDAAEGEKLDPDNAFFPLMRAAGYFAAHRDTEGLEAVRRASRKIRFDSFIEDEANATWKLTEMAFGAQSAALRTAQFQAIPMPHLPQLRAVGSMVAYKAAQAELSGHVEEGAALRHACALCGSLMRIQSHAVASAIVGVVVMEEQRDRPGGAKAPNFADELTAAQKEQILDQDYIAYLQRIKHPDEASWMAAQLAVGRQVRDIADKSANANTPTPARASIRLTTYWMLDAFLLVSGLETAVLAVTGILLIRYRRNLPATSAWVDESAAVPATLLAIVVIGFLVFAWSSHWGEALGALRSVIHALAPAASDADIAARTVDSGDRLANPTLAQWAAMGVSVLIPVVTLITLIGVAGARKLDYPSVLSDTLRIVTAFLSLLLLILYSISAFQTAVQERQLDASLNRMIENEGRYDADLLGVPWPAAKPPG